MARVWHNEDYEHRDGLIRSYFYSGFTYAEIVFDVEHAQQRPTQRFTFKEDLAKNGA